MPFELSIKCSKDISELHINFTDGTCSTIGTPEKAKNNQEACFINTDETETTHKNEIIELPEIPDRDDTIKVAEELQNLDI